MAATNPFDPNPVANTTSDPTSTVGTNTSGANVAPTGAPATTTAPSPGILTAAMNPVVAGTTADKTASATPTNYTAGTAANTQWNVTAPQTVAGQLSSVIDQNSPLLQKAQADAAQTANGRGLLNSSMAAGAGTSALLDKALQIATPDAQTNAAAGAANAASANTTSQFNTGQTNQAAGVNANAANTASLANAQAKNAATSQDAASALQASTTNLQASVQTATTAYQGALQTALNNSNEADKLTLGNIDAQVRTNLAQIQAQYQTQMQTSQSASTMYAQTMNSIGQIMQDPNLDAGAKQNLINQAMDTFKAGLNIQMAITNIPGVADLVSNLGAPGAGAQVGNGATNGPVPGMVTQPAPSTPGVSIGAPPFENGSTGG